MAFIYKTTNLINGKIYIGKTTRLDDNYYGSGTLITAAINKYGKENFIREILEEVSDAEVDEKERFYIEQTNSKNKEIGYNIANGGEGGSVYWDTLTAKEKETQRQLISIGRKNGKSGYTEQKAIALAEGRKQFWNNVSKEWIDARSAKKRKCFVCIDFEIGECSLTDNLKEFCNSVGISYDNALYNARTKKSKMNNKWAFRKLEDYDISSFNLALIEQEISTSTAQAIEAISISAKKRIQAKNSNAKYKKFKNVNTGIVAEFYGNFYTDAKKLTGCSPESLLKTASSLKPNRKGWVFVE